nr:methyltransferase [Ancylobacter dichloromethanicus]
MLDDTGYAGTELLRTLQSNNPHSLRDLALIQGGPGHWAPWGRLDDALRTGRTQTEATLGQSLWDYYASDAGRAEGLAVAGAMGGSTRDIDAAAVAAVSTTNVHTAVDVGGAGGSLLQALMQANPALNGIVLDLPSVIEQVREQPLDREIASRLSFVPGSFFDAVPAADLYILRHILHDWSDAECAVILRNCRASARPGAHLMLIELTMARQPSGFACQVDLTMLIAAGGRERQPAEYDRLLSQAGFRLLGASALTPTHSRFEAVAI